MLDVAIAVLLGIISIAMAYLGVHLTMHPAESPKARMAYKIAFASCALVEAALPAI